MSTKTPKEILSETSPQVRMLIEKVLKIEGEYQHFQNLDMLKDKQKELCKRLAKLVEQEVQL